MHFLIRIDFDGLTWTWSGTTCGNWVSQTLVSVLTQHWYLPKINGDQIMSLEKNNIFKLKTLEVLIIFLSRPWGNFGKFSNIQLDRCISFQSNILLARSLYSRFGFGNCCCWIPRVMWVKLAIYGTCPQSTNCCVVGAGDGFCQSTTVLFDLRTSLSASFVQKWNSRPATL